MATVIQVDPRSGAVKVCIGSDTRAIAIRNEYIAINCNKRNGREDSFDGEIRRYRQAGPYRSNTLNLSRKEVFVGASPGSNSRKFTKRPREHA